MSPMNTVLLGLDWAVGVGEAVTVDKVDVVVVEVVVVVLVGKASGDALEVGTDGLLHPKNVKLTKAVSKLRRIGDMISAPNTCPLV